MNPKTVIQIRKEGLFWRIRRGGQKFECIYGLSRLFRMISTLIVDKEDVTSIRIEILRKKKT